MDINTKLRDFFRNNFQNIFSRKRLYWVLFGAAFLTFGTNFLTRILLYPHNMDGQYSKLNMDGFRNPQDRQLPFENITIQCDQDVLKGWFIKQVNVETAPTVVFFHENAGNIGWRLDYLEKYYKAVGCNLLIIAYSGYDESTGSPSQDAIQKNAIAISKYAFEKLNINPNKIYAHGRSLGGAVAAYAVNSATQYNYQGLILENTFTSIQDVVSQMNPLFRLISKLIVVDTWCTKNIIPQIKIPLLFISCTQLFNINLAGRDELIPYKLMKQLKSLATNSQKVKEHHIELGDHNSNWQVNPPLYFKNIKEFLE